MKTSDELMTLLRRIDHKGYPAYKDTKGIYQFLGYVLDIEHVQGDPFASPSKIKLIVAGKDAGLPKELYDKKHKRIAFESFVYGAWFGKERFDEREPLRSGSA